MKPTFRHWWPQSVRTVSVVGYLSLLANQAFVTSALNQSTSPVPYQVERTQVPAYKSDAQSETVAIPSLPHITATAIDSIRQTAVQNELGTDGVRLYRDSKREQEKNTLFYRAVMKADYESVEAYKAIRPLNKGFFSHIPDPGSGTLQALDELLKDSSILNRRVVRDFLSTHQGKAATSTPMKLTELQLRVTAALLEQPRGLVLTVFYALSPEPKIRELLLPMYFSTQADYESFFATHTTPEELANGLRDVLLAFCYRSITPRGMRLWGTEDVARRIIGKDEYEVLFKYSYSDRGASLIDAAFGAAGTKAFRAGEDESGASASSVEEKDKYRLQLATASALVIDLQERCFLIQHMAAPQR